MTTPSPQARQQILARIRRSLQVGDGDADRRVEVQKRLANPHANTIPGRAVGEPGRLAEDFKERLSALGATFEAVARKEDVPGCIAAYLRASNLPASLRMGDDVALASIPWAVTPQLEIKHGRAMPADDVSLSRAFAAASETGTLVLVSGPANPTTLNFLTDTHIVLVERGAVVGSYEEIWQRLRDVYGDRNLPRTVNFVSGPSRTGDIEGIIIMGAHGPRRLHVLLLGDA